MRSRYHGDYVKSDRVITVNNDPDLEAIDIPMPECPEWKTIDGYGIAPHLQKFQYQVMPKRLKELQEHTKTREDVERLEQKSDEIGKNYTASEVIEILEENQREYKLEILWIKKQWRRLLNGYWFFNNGKPTYIDGWHYVYLNFWNINSGRRDGLPEYRWRDTMFFHFARYCYRHPKILGFLYPKHRREGATSKACLINYFSCIIHKKHYHGIQSLSDKHVKKLWRNNLIEPWRELPFFFKPETNSSDAPSSILEFKPKREAVGKGGIRASSKSGLQGWIDHRTSGLEMYDGDQLHFYHFDEFGKRSKKNPVDSYERYMIVRECLIEGDDKIGFAIGTSTIGSDDENGGMEYFDKFVEFSNYSHLNSNGMTDTGLYMLFISAEINLQGYTDPYGNPITEDPEIPVINSQGKVVKIGARSHLEGKRRSLEDKKAWRALSEEKRKFPIFFRETRTPAGKDALFPMEKINQGIQKANAFADNGRPMHETWLRRGNLELFNNDLTQGVYFADHEEGNWFISQFPKKSKANKYYYDNRFEGNCMVPMDYNVYTISYDPVKYEKTKHGGRSLGAITVRRTFDETVDFIEGVPKPMDEWLTDQWVATWLVEVDDYDLMALEVLKAAMFYHGFIYGENNIDNINKEIKRKGYHGYLMHKIDEKTGKLDPNAGFSTQGNSKQLMFQEMNKVLDRRAPYEKHIRILEQARSMRKHEDLTSNDLMASAMGNLMAERNLYTRFVEDSVLESIDYDDLFPARRIA